MAGIQAAADAASVVMMMMVWRSHMHALRRYKHRMKQAAHGQWRSAGWQHRVANANEVKWCNNRYVDTFMVGGSVAEWLARWTQAREGMGSNRSSDAVE